jgi:hypothetical protein
LFWVFRKLDQFIIGEGGSLGEKRGGANTGHKQELAHSFPPDTLGRGAWHARSRGAGTLSLDCFPAACQDTGKTVKIPQQRSFHNKAAPGKADAPSSGKRQGTPSAKALKAENSGNVYIDPGAVTIVIPKSMFREHVPGNLPGFFDSGMP